MLHEIITVGKNLESTLLGIKEFGPDIVHLILTDETSSICSSMKTLLPKSIKVHEYKVEPNDGNMIEKLCLDIRSSYDNDTELKFLYNLSEGTNIMLFAALRAAQEKGDCAFCITQEGNMVDLSSFNSYPLQNSLDNDEFATMYGNKLDSYQDIDTIKEDDILTAIAVKNFIENKYNIYKAIRKYCKSDSNEYRLSNARLTIGGTNVQMINSNGKFTIIQNMITIFRSQNPNIASLMFGGRWWEILISDVVKQWNDCHHPEADIWRSVIFQNEDDDNIKNEIDIMANDKYRLVLIECKSGEVNQDDIYKINSVRDTYGGEYSKAILVSYLPLSQALQDKCEDLQIKFFAPKNGNRRLNYYKKFPEWLDSVLTENEI